MRKRKTDWRFFKKLRVRSVAPWIVDFNGFLISMDGFFEGCSIASKIPMDDQNSLKFTFSMDFFETVFFRGFFHRDKICNPSHHPEYNCNMSASSTEEKASSTEELKGMLIQILLTTVITDNGWWWFSYRFWRVILSEILQKDSNIRIQLYLLLFIKWVLQSCSYWLIFLH